MKAILPKFDFTVADTQTSVYHANKGEGIPKHEHAYSHVTYCCSGKIVVRKEGREVTLDKDSQPVSLRANEWHEIESLCKGTVFINVFEQGKT